MATLYVPRCGQGMVEDLTSGIGASSPGALAALASAMASAGITGGPKASSAVPLSGSFAVLPAESTVGSFTVSTAGILIFNAAIATTPGTHSAGGSAFTMFLYKNSQKFSGQSEAIAFPASTPGIVTGASTCGIIPVAPGDVISVRAGVAGISGSSVDPANSYAHYVII